MSEKNTGWIKLHRKIQETKGYFAEPFCKNMAWVDLLLFTNHQDNFFYVRDVRVDVNRGQCAYASETLGKRWNWSRGKVTRFLKQLQKDDKVVLHNSKVITRISIVNYDVYQSDGTTNGTTKPTTKKAAREQAKGQLTNTNKNANNDNNEKHDKNSLSLDGLNGFQAPSLEEVVAFFAKHEYGETGAKVAFSYYESGDWKDKDGNKVLNWKQSMIRYWFKHEYKMSSDELYQSNYKPRTGVIHNHWE